MHREETKRNGATVVTNRTYDWSDFLEQIEKPGVALNGSSHSNSNSFCGGYSYTDAVRLARTGDSESATKMLDGVHALQAEESFKRVDSFDYDVAGCFPDVPEYLSGNPCYMVTPGDNVIARNPVVHLLVNRGVSCAIEPETQVRYGIAALTLVMELERAGYTVALETYVPLSGGASYKSLTRTMVKTEDEPLDIDRVAFALVNVGYFRRLGFRLIELEASNVSLGSCYGYPAALDEIADEEPGVVRLPGLQTLRDTSSALAIYNCLEETWRKDWVETVGFDFGKLNG